MTEHQQRVGAALAAFARTHPGHAPTYTRKRSGATPEGKLLLAIKAALHKEPGLLLWRNSVGATKHEGRLVTYGLAVGSADFIGLLDGRFIALEAKTAAGRLSDAQSSFLDMVRRFGGFACVVRSAADAVAAIARARRGATA